MIRYFEYNIGRLNYRVRTGTSIADLLRLIGEEAFALVLLDLMLPDGESLDVEQPHVAVEPSKASRGECCRDPAPRLKGLVGETIDDGFLKRRTNMAPHSMAIGLDQIPESLFPLLACRAGLSLNALDIFAGVAAFFVGERLLSRLLFMAHIRDRPY